MGRGVVGAFSGYHELTDPQKPKESKTEHFPKGDAVVGGRSCLEYVLDVMEHLYCDGQSWFGMVGICLPPLDASQN